MSNLKKGEELTKREYLAAMFIKAMLSNSDRETVEMTEFELVSVSVFLTDELLKQLQND